MRTWKALPRAHRNTPPPYPRCDVPGCDETGRHAKYGRKCHAHHQRMEKYGDPNVCLVPKKYPTFIAIADDSGELIVDRRNG